MIDYRELTTMDEFRQLITLELLIWQMEPGEAISSHILRVAQHVGGCIIGAYDNDEMIGFAVAFPMRDGRLWSHIAGVHPDYQAQGIGTALKHQQRDWALERGFTRMSWTFDPLLRRNAYFNIMRLGARSRVYLQDFYGEMHDGFNAGLPSDRLEMTWYLDEPPVTLPDEAAHSRALLRMDDDQRPDVTAHTGDDYYTVTIPANIAALKQADMLLALAWRHAVRETLTTAFAAGYEAAGFRRHDDHGVYILRRIT